MSADMVTLTIDGESIDVPKGTLIIRAAEQLGIHIPRFCDHPLLKPAGACRQCLVEVAMPGRDGVVAKMPKPQPACTMVCTPGMEVYTQRTSEVADKAQRGIMEFLLINHPLDCPICDKGGECPLQNQAMTHGNLSSRFVDIKRTWEKPVALSSLVLLDRDRCVLCQRCVRFSKQIAGDPFIDLQGRGGGSHDESHHDFMGENIGAFDANVLGFASEQTLPLAENRTEPMSNPWGQDSVISSNAVGPVEPKELDVNGNLFASYFSGNTIQICPVGALTSSQYRFRGRPFDLASTRGVTEQDASGAVIRTDIRRGEIVRRMAQQDMDVNEEWISDKDRFAYSWQFTKARLTSPMVRIDGNLVKTSWSEALRVAAKGLKKAAADNGVGYLPGGRLTFEDAYAWGKFARVVTASPDIDQRTRATDGEEDAFLGHYVAGTGMPVTYKDVETAGKALLVALEPEDECATLFLRMRKGVLAGSLEVATVATFRSRGSEKLNARLLPAAPGTEAEVVSAIANGTEGYADVGTDLGVILVGERAAASPGLLSAVVELHKRTGARIAWVPRRSGERGGIEAGITANLLPFGRCNNDPEARADLAAVWGAEIPAQPGRNVHEILAAAESGHLSALVLGGIDQRDFPSVASLKAAMRGADFVVALEVNETPVTKCADVVLPVAPVSEKNGTFINWEGRLRPFGQALVSTDMSDREVLNRLAEVMGINLGLATLKELHAEANELMNWDGIRRPFKDRTPVNLPTLEPGQAILATHKPLLDAGLLQAGAHQLAGTQLKPVARVSPLTAQNLGEKITISTDSGSLTLPLVACEMPDHVVWVPECSGGSEVHETLRVSAGAVVNVTTATEVKQ